MLPYVTAICSCDLEACYHVLRVPGCDYSREHNRSWLESVITNHHRIYVKCPLPDCDQMTEIDEDCVLAEELRILDENLDDIGFIWFKL